MSILVTGGAGFIGSHVLDRLAAEQRHSVCLDNFNDYYDPDLKRKNVTTLGDSEFVQIEEGDIRNEEQCRDIFRRYSIDRVIHLAARAGVRPSIEQPVLYEEVNCTGTLNLLECARDEGVEMFVFGSSSSVYGESTCAPFSEDEAADRPVSPYAATKRSGELFAHTYHHLFDFPVVALRFFTVYGPRQRPDLAIHKFVRLMDEGKPIPMYGDGSSKRDYTYVDDIVDGVLAAVDSKLEFEIINLGNSNPVQLSDLIDLIGEAVGREPKINQLPDQPGDVPLTCADVTKAEALLNYSPQVSIQDGLSRFVEWYRSSNH
ncbi:MAG: NAD-dependent epimerase/dehydratase family protein [Planctomycetota bacterium]